MTTKPASYSADFLRLRLSNGVPDQNKHRLAMFEAVHGRRQDYLAATQPNAAERSVLAMFEPRRDE